MASRTIYTSRPLLNAEFKYPSNYQSTTKYNLLTFVPVSLLSQFKKVANIYFLCTAVLQSWPAVSPLDPFSAIAPLVFVLTVSMTREGVEDYLRYKSDKETNSTPVLIYDERFTKKTFKDVQVGDVIMIEKDEVFPADLILLTACNENGVAFIETSTLDGEKNLKPRNSLPSTMQLDDLHRWKDEFKIECEGPNPKIYSFSGKIWNDGKVESLDKNNLLLGGAFLRNTTKVIGVVIYTGTETKLRQNLMAKTSKESKVEKRVNRYILIIIFVQFCLCLTAAVGCYLFLDANRHDHKYIRGLGNSNGVQATLTYFTYFLLLNTMLPISLTITLELLKVFQGYFMQSDLEMYSELRDRPCKVSSYNITEELGMVQHIFSDKTGTLTCNRMEFKFCSVGNKVYGDRKFLHDLDYVSMATYSTREIIFTFEIKDILNDTFSKSGFEQALSYKFQFKSLTLSRQDQLLNWFLRCLAICHECMVEYDDKILKYVGQSPDEITLVDAARQIGIEYNNIHKNIITLKITALGGKAFSEKYEKICVNEFDSDRKRNSVLVKDLKHGRVLLFVKGADNVIRSRLSKNNSKDYVDKIDKDLIEYSNRGLRTLLIAMRIVDADEFEVWKGKFDRASTDIDNRQELLNRLAEEIEVDLILLGCTAVEDALQAEVPSTIRSILKAGIKLWMLTGDKLETAINIGKTCGLISNHTKVLSCSESDLSKCQSLLSLYQKKSERHYKKSRELALVIEGSSLEIILFDHKDPEKIAKYPEYSSNPQTSDLAHSCRLLFLEISSKCASVICCRVTPGQKREVVRLMKQEQGCISLAVGDGANDVSMILEADVGVGIYGEEGMQAIQASDYGIGEFRFLWELLLVHGRFNYLRVSEMILYFFYKNIVFTIPQFLYAFYCGFSGKSVYDDWYISLYNTIFTAAPLMSRALFEKDIMIPKRLSIETEEDSMIRGLVPCVYGLGRDNEIFTGKNFTIWVVTGFFHSLIVFFIPLYAVQAGIIDSAGHNADFWVFSITSFTCIVFLVNVRIALYSRVWTTLHIVSIVVLSIVLYLLFMVTYDYVSPTAARGSVVQIYSTPYFYVILITILILSFVFDGGILISRRILRPSKSEVLSEYSINSFQKKQLNRAIAKSEGLTIN